MSPDRTPRCTRGRQSHLSEQAGEGRELIRGWRHSEPRHGAGGRAAARTDKRQLPIKC